jgi:hypothetical protein
MCLVAYVRLAGSVEDLSSGHLLFGLAELEVQLFPIRVWMHAESICFAYSVVELLSELCLVTKTRFGIPKDLVPTCQDGWARTATTHDLS